MAYRRRTLAACVQELVLVARARVHAGEEELDACMSPFGGFDHNVQTFRVVTDLERRYRALVEALRIIAAEQERRS